MGGKISPRVVKAGPYWPTVALTGDESNSAFRLNNLILRGLPPSQYWETFSGLGDLNEPLDMVALTGTLTLTVDSTTVTGVGTAFFSEVRLGQKITAIASDDSTSWPLVARRVVSDTEIEVWRAPDSSASGVIGWRMSRMYAINAQRGSSSWGGVDPLDKGSFIGAGAGVFQLNGQPLSASWTLARHPSIALFDAATDTYTNFPLGMNTPAAPTLAAVGGGTKGMQAGSYSAVILPARSQTGGYNNPSPRADVTIATGDKVQFTLPAMDTANGQDAWWLAVTPYVAAIGANLGYLQGPWFFWVMITTADVSAGGGTYTTEWLDAEIVVNEIVSFDNDAPTDAEGVVSLNNAPVYFSCQGQGASTNPTQTSPGPFIVPSKPNNIEAAPLELAFSSSPPETILWALSGQGRIYLPTINHLQIAQATPDDAVPILIRPFWHDGFAGPDQLVFVNGMIYGFPNGGPSRSVGDGDEIDAERAWAARVYAITQSWSPGHVVVGYDPYNNGIWFFYCGARRNSAGFWTTQGLLYGLPQQDWIGACEYSEDNQDQIVSGLATIGDRLELVVGGRRT